MFLSLEFSEEACENDNQVFTTMRVSNTHVYFWKEHLKRIHANLEYLYDKNTKIYPSDMKDDIEAILIRRIRNDVRARGEFRVRLSFFFKEDDKLYFHLGIFECAGKIGEHPPHHLTIVKKSQDKLKPTTLKSGTYREILELKKEKAALGFTEIIFIDSENFVLEAGTSNIFLLKNEKEVITPPLRDGVLTGTCRENLIYFFRVHGITVLEREISKEEIMPDEHNNLILTNGVWGAQEVRTIEGMMERQKYIKSSFWKDMIHAFHVKMGEVHGEE